MKSALALTVVAYQLAIAQTTPPNQNAEAAVEREWGRPSGPFQMSISSDRKEYRHEDTIVLTVTLKNVGGEQVHLRRRLPMMFYDIDVSLPTPAWIPYRPKAPLTPRGSAEKNPARASTMGSWLDPERESVDKFELNKLFQMGVPGDYRITLSCKQPSSRSGEPDITITSNEIILTVLPGR